VESRAVGAAEDSEDEGKIVGVIALVNKPVSTAEAQWGDIVSREVLFGSAGFSGIPGLFGFMTPFEAWAVSKVYSVKIRGISIFYDAW